MLSDRGRLVKTRLLRPYQGMGRSRFTASDGGKDSRYVYYLDRLILLAFKGEEYRPGLVPKHIDGNGRNDALSNLCWAEPASRRSLTDEQASLAVCEIKNGKSSSEIAKLLGTTIPVISNIRQGKTYKTFWDDAAHG